MIELLNKYYEESIALDTRFDEIKDKKWNYLTVLNELMVQVGHLYTVASSSQTVEEYRNINNIGDEICDVIFQLILLVKYLDYDINKIEYNFSENTLEAFMIVLGQTSEVILEKANFRFSKPREGFDDINEYIYQKISQLFSIILNYAKINNVDIDKEYSLLLDDANNFIDNYNKKND